MERSSHSHPLSKSYELWLSTSYSGVSAYVKSHTALAHPTRAAPFYAQYVIFATPFRPWTGTLYDGLLPHIRRMTHAASFSNRKLYVR